MNQDNWATLPDHVGYEISTAGVVRNAKTQKPLSPARNQRGILYVSLRSSSSNRFEAKSLARLVAEAFCDGQDRNQDTILHLDGNKENIDVSNLKWTTRWHAIRYHREMNMPSRRQWSTKRIKDCDTGIIYEGSRAAARATGCCPSNIEYACEYNATYEANQHPMLAQFVYPGSRLFRHA